MTPFKILIVEDEILIADNLQRYLTKKGYQVAGIAISYEEAEQLYLKEKPDIVLLDIRINGSKTGIDFAHFIQQQPQPQPFIFLTSQVDFKNINDAKETFPAGYLSKPIQKESLLASIEIAMYKHLKDNEEIAAIPLYDGTKNHLVPLKDILYLQAEHVYVKVYVKENNFIIQRSSLKILLDQLPSDHFLQTHRSFAINLKQVSRWDTENIYVGDKAIPVSRSRRKEVFSLLA